METTMSKSVRYILVILAALAFIASGCGSENGQDHENEPVMGAVLALPAMSPAQLGGAPLKVVATTSMIGDVIAQVGGSTIELTTLMGPGQDPHSYEPTPRDMAAVAQADVVFVNGWDLEEALARDLNEIIEGMSVVPISAGIEPIEFGETHEEDEDDEHGHQNIDPHVWFSVQNVKRWTENAEQVLTALDPAHADAYHGNADAYLAKLDELDAYAQAQLASIPEERRFLVTNHRSLDYMARDYGLRIVGTVVPAASTMAEPSASDLVALIEIMEKQGICSLYTETTISDRLAQTVADELEGCAQVRVLKLYTGAIGLTGSGADSYVGMYRHNVDTIVDGLR
jgi:ABC-type Zn uptake system ZnuABC Zn-binding protein ZnuA